MAIEYSLLLKEEYLTKENLIKKLFSIGYHSEKIDNFDKGMAIYLFEEIGCSIYLVDSPCFPYNRWKTDFIDDEFTYKKVLKFRYSKEYADYLNRYSFMLEIIFGLMDDIKQDAIFLSNGDTELCYFSVDNPILLNNVSGIWDRDCFKNIISNRNVRYLN